MKNRFMKHSSRILAMILAASMVISLGADITSATNVYAAESTEYTCGKEEHSHTDECYKEQLTCGKETGDGAAEGHQHDLSCYEDKTLHCDNEDEDHQHDEACYDLGELTCGKETGEGATEGHQHDDSCYEDVLICGYEEEHTHSDSCKTSNAKPSTLDDDFDSDEDTNPTNGGVSNETSTPLDSYIVDADSYIEKTHNGVTTRIDPTNAGTVTIEDGDSVYVSVAYHFDKNSVVTADKPTVTYTLPAGLVPNEQIHGAVSGKINGTQYDNLGELIINTDGSVTITFNDTFFTNAKDADFDGTIWFQGTASGNSDNTNKEVKFKSDGTSYTITPKEGKSSLSVAKTGAFASGNTATYEVTFTNNGTADTGEITITDYLGLTNLDKSQVTYKDVKIDGVAVDSSKYTIEDNGDSGKKLTINNVPALAAGASYKLTYTVDYGKRIGEGNMALNNQIHGSEGGNDSQHSKYLQLDKMIEKTGAAADNNSKIEWTIQINKGCESGVAGEWSISDLLNDSNIDWSKTSDFSITRYPNTWHGNGEDVTSSLESGVKNSGKITIADGYCYEIKYKTAVDTTESTYTATNKTTIDKGGQEYSSTGTATVTQAVWKNTKKGDGVKAEDDGNTAIASWTSTVTLPKRTDEDGNGFNSEGMDFTDVLMDSSKQVNADVHYTTPAQIEGSLVVKLDNSKLSSSDYTITYYNGDTKVTANDATATKFVVHVNGPRTGTTMTFSYKTTMNISNVAEGGSLTVWNKSTAGGVDSEASQEYKKEKSFTKQGFEYTAVNQGAYKDGDITNKYEYTGGKLKYRIIWSPTANQQVVTDTLPEGITSAGDIKYGLLEGGQYDRGSSYWVDGTNVDMNENGAFHPTVENGNGILKVTIPAGFPQTEAASKFQYYIEYSITLDEATWKDLATKSEKYTNTVEWNGEHKSQTTTVDNDYKEVRKFAEQNKDDYGNSINKVTYYVLINPAAEKLNRGNVLTMTDNMTLPSNVTASLDLSSVKLHKYDATKTGEGEHYAGDVLDNSTFTLSYDAANTQMTITVPDATAYVLEYTYTIYYSSNDTSTLNVVNNVELAGSKVYDDSKSTQVIKSQGGGTVSKDQNTFELVKVDSQHYQTVLPNAEFKLYKYDNITDSTNPKWTEVAGKNLITADGTGKLIIKEDDAELNLTADTLYKLVEVTPPTGYTLPTTYTPYYFVFLSQTSSEDSVWTSLGTTINDSGANYYPAGTTTNKTVQKSEVTFVAYNDSATVMAPNRYGTVEVTKTWTDYQGNTISNPEVDSIDVTLYKAHATSNAVTLTLNLTTDSGNRTSFTGTYKVRSGTQVALRVTGINNDNQSDFTTPDGWTYSYDSTNKQVTLTSPESGYTSDANISINRSWDWGSNDWRLLYVKGGAAVDDSSRKKVETVKLSAENNWKYTWSNLEVGDGNSLWYYFVEETVPEGYTVSYIDNAGIESGQITIINKKEYSLPKTGGSGTLPYTLGGLTAILFSLLSGGYVYRRKYICNK